MKAAVTMIQSVASFDKVWHEYCVYNNPKYLDIVGENPQFKSLTVSMMAQGLEYSLCGN